MQGARTSIGCGSLQTAVASASCPGRVGIVTGAASGIGKGVALHMAREGHRVACVDLREEDRHGIMEDLSAVGAASRCIYIACDVSEEKAVERMVQEVATHFGRIDWAFNNAGVLGNCRLSKLHDWTADEMALATDVNITGVFLCMKHELRQMIKQRKEESTAGAPMPDLCIVNTSSVAGISGKGSRQSGYAATKWAVTGMTKTAAVEYGQMGIRVNCVAPGVVDTPMYAITPDNLKKLIVSKIPLRRPASVADVGNAVSFLIDSKSNYLSGVVLPIDGGFTAN